MRIVNIADNVVADTLLYLAIFNHFGSHLLSSLYVYIVSMMNIG